MIWLRRDHHHRCFTQTPSDCVVALRPRRLYSHTARFCCLITEHIQIAADLQQSKATEIIRFADFFVVAPWAVSSTFCRAQRQGSSCVRGVIVHFAQHNFVQPNLFAFRA